MRAWARFATGEVMLIIAIILSLASFAFAPSLAAQVMRLKGKGVGRGALVGSITLGLYLMTGLVSTFLGPLGDLLAIMLFLAAWYQTVRVVHGTDGVRTVAFMFWQLFFVLLIQSLVAWIITPSVAKWFLSLAF
jgi:hypothetical protein